MGQEHGGSERRRAERAKDVLLSKYSSSDAIKILLMLGGQKFNVALLDLSESGMAVASKYMVPCGSAPLIRFVFLTRDISIEGRIVHVDMIKTGGYRLGIQFDKVNPQDRTTIANFLKNIVSREKILPPQ